jgi:hypothetical protein
MRQQRELGEKLKRDVLLEILGAADYAFLNSESLFGVMNRRLRARMPIVLAFGFETGAALYSLQNQGGRNRREVGNMCAIFNLGISIFDLICDNFPAEALELTQWFDHRPSTSSRPRGGLVALSPNLRDSQALEVRLLAKLVAWFFEQLDSHAGTSNQAVFKRVKRHLLEAYRAEMNSFHFPRGPRNRPLKISRIKSTLPFVIIAELSSLFVLQPRNAVMLLVRNLTKHLATGFWLTDDLVDIIDDSRTGALNSAIVCLEHNLAWRKSNKRKSVVRRLLETDHIEELAARIAEHNARVSRILNSSLLPRRPAQRLRRVVLSYTRDWLESRA